MERLCSNVVSKIKACKKEMLRCRDEDGTGSEEEEGEEGGKEEGAPEPGS